MAAKDVRFSESARNKMMVGGLRTPAPKGQGAAPPSGRSCSGAT